MSPTPAVPSGRPQPGTPAGPSGRPQPGTPAGPSSRPTELLRQHPVLARLGELFAENGHEIALVGGPVRDALLGRPVNDLDLATSARPEQIEQTVKGWADAVWDVGREFGTIGLRKGDDQIEITTYRSDEYETGSRKPVVAFTPRL